MKPNSQRAIECFGLARTTHNDQTRIIEFGALLQGRSIGTTRKNGIKV
jgi:hypothetical protein